MRDLVPRVLLEASPRPLLQVSISILRAHSSSRRSQRPAIAGKDHLAVVSEQPVLELRDTLKGLCRPKAGRTTPSEGQNTCQTTPPTVPRSTSGRPRNGKREHRLSARPTNRPHNSATRQRSSTKPRRRAARPPSPATTSYSPTSTA